jgi:hypothetical protein
MTIFTDQFETLPATLKWEALNRWTMYSTGKPCLIGGYLSGATKWKSKHLNFKLWKIN